MKKNLLTNLGQEWYIAESNFNIVGYSTTATHGSWKDDIVKAVGRCAIMKLTFLNLKKIKKLAESQFDKTIIKLMLSKCSSQQFMAGAFVTLRTMGRLSSSLQNIFG